MPFKTEHSVRVKQPKGYSRYRRKNLTRGVDAILGFKKGGGSEIQALRFDKEKFTPEEAAAWAKKHGHTGSLHPAQKSDNMSVADVSVRMPVKNISVKYGNQPGAVGEGTMPEMGQAGPGQGMGYIKFPPDAGPKHISLEPNAVTYGELHNPQLDIPAGTAVGVVRSMPRPVVADPKSSLTDIETKQKQVPTSQDIHTLESVEEQKDLSGITYGTAAYPYDVITRKPMYGLQRSIPTSYAEAGSSGLDEDPEWDDILDLVTDKDIDGDEFLIGAKHELEHTDDRNKAAKVALDHLIEIPDYYSRLLKAFPEEK